jgi:S1-C subfamily serine protease
MKKYLSYISLILTIITAVATLAESGQQPITLWDRVRFSNLKAGQSYEISSGTGFFVNNNYIVTNEHVVDGCRNIAVRGAIQPSLVTIVAKDKELDLAILYSEYSSTRSANLRANEGLKEGDLLFIVGYPLDYGKIGRYLIKEAQLIRSLSNSLKQFSTIEFTNTIEQGNSGGPLLDKNTNVVGVIRAKKTYYNPENPQIVYNTTGVAIGLDGLTSFLKRHGVLYNTQTSYDLFTNYQLDNLTKDFIVNIHCVK